MKPNTTWLEISVTVGREACEAVADLAKEFERALVQAGLHPVEHLTEEDWLTVVTRT